MKLSSTLLYRSAGISRSTMGSMEVTFPKRTSGMYSAHTTCAQPPESARFSAPDLDGHSSHRCRQHQLYSQNPGRVAETLSFAEHPCIGRGAAVGTVSPLYWVG